MIKKASVKYILPQSNLLDFLSIESSEPTVQLMPGRAHLHTAIAVKILFITKEILTVMDVWIWCLPGIIVAPYVQGIYRNLKLSIAI